MKNIAIIAAGFILASALVACFRYIMDIGRNCFHIDSNVCLAVKIPVTVTMIVL